MDATRLFSANYRAAREKFLRAAGAAGAALESHENPAAAPDGEGLFTDVALLGRGGGRAVLGLCSATHGVEGFAGSAFQSGLLENGIGARLGAETGLVLIHAINPFGFAHLRRANEDNVDLNRNFIDHSKAPPPNPHYAALAEAIAPARYSPGSRAASLGRLAWFQAFRGRAALHAAITGGQYAYPRGLFYGGRSETWSNRPLRTIVEGHFSGVSRVGFVDFHTGLGPRGHGEVIVQDPPGSPAALRAKAWWGERVKLTRDGEAVSAEISGSLKLAIASMLPDAEVTAAVLEFGTSPATQVFRAMQAENWLHHRGAPDPGDGAAIKARMRAVFYPDTDPWKERVWRQGRQVVEQALKALNDG